MATKSVSPYAQALGDHDPEEVIAATPARLEGLLQSLPPERIEARPAPGKWNLREVMIHLTECEVAWAWRLRYAFEKDHAVLQPFDQDVWARRAGSYSFEQAQTTFAALRAWNLSFIRGLSEADKARHVTHPERGEWTLWTIVETMAGHDLHHLRGIERQIGS